AARADWVVTLDGDGQNDPADIMRLFVRLEDPQAPPQLQLIAGLRRRRQDNWRKRLASRWANAIRQRLLQDQIMDTGCSLKLFSRRAFLALPHFNHMHRFLPALFLRGGGHIMMVEVNHRPRLRGRSKYGLHNRLWVGIVDMLGVMWLQRRSCFAEIIEDNQDNEY
ncbi:MAG: dolichol-phosphate mannosyltransferase, partial [Pseudomonadota bacterium]|nr:dolichol-phosphate mannosyltransferase [Pseudomonadota bacterium]